MMRCEIIVEPSPSVWAERLICGVFLWPGRLNTNNPTKTNTSSTAVWGGYVVRRRRRRQRRRCTVLLSTWPTERGRRIRNDCGQLLLLCRRWCAVVATVGQQCGRRRCWAVVAVLRCAATAATAAGRVDFMHGRTQCRQLLLLLLVLLRRRR